MVSGIVAACVLPIEEGPVNILIGNDAEVPVKASFHGLSLASSLIEHFLVDCCGVEYCQYSLCHYFVTKLVITAV